MTGPVAELSQYTLMKCTETAPIYPYTLLNRLRKTTVYHDLNNSQTLPDLGSNQLSLESQYNILLTDSQVTKYFKSNSILNYTEWCITFTVFCLCTYLYCFMIILFYFFVL